MTMRSIWWAVLLAGCGAQVSGGDGGTATCSTYCAAVMANCVGPQVQYSQQAACLGACQTLAQGASGATAGNSLECRAFHASAAAQAPATHCSAAGPAGDGACGSNCEGFCTIAMGACPGQFASAADCNAACAGFTGTAGHYSATASSGNTFTCRLYHLSVATTDASRCPAVLTTSPICQ